MNYWLVKSEPNCFSIDDLKKNKTQSWDGVRNYQARNFMMEMKKGDAVLFYHSTCAIPGIVGLATISKESHPDHTAWDPKSEHPDPKSKPEKPIWFMVQVKFKEKFKKILTLEEMRKMKSLEKMKILQKGSRLSVTPVTKKEFETIIKKSS